ncbi:outer membrane protein [Bradyrhizobium oligotrophicum]|uniref:outer membrane protein n=1 Tax=Bradyrhizobium oligotrophicum TaxID=44255 RepID=UPI003EBAA629
MKAVYNLVVAACGVLLAGTAAQAGDFRGQRPVAVYDAPYYNWTGFYAGAFAGGAHGLWTVDFYRNNNHGHAEEGADGVAFGLYGGYNYQFANRFVVGAEVDLGKSTASQSNDIFDNDSSYAKYGMFGSVRARVGYAFDRLLVFGTLGVGIANLTNNIQKGRNAGEQVVWEDQVKAGLTTGVGVEYAFTNNWVGRGEYVYTDYGNVTLFNRDGNRADFKNELHLLRVGASYRF